MQTFAYCMKSVAETVWLATGEHPVTSPPFSASTFNPAVFLQADVIWLGLHGMEDDPTFLYGDEVAAQPFPIRIRALAVNDLMRLNLTGKIVYASSCYLPQTDFPGMLKAAGAIIIGGPGENYGSSKGLAGVDLLGKTFVEALRVGAESVEAALEAAKTVLGHSKADRDAREFKIL